jgi:hypothetical protein
MALTKVQADGVNLSDDFAFSGTVTGAGLTSPFANSVAITAEGGTATTNIAQGLAKVWAKWNGVGNSITDSFNVSSASDTGSGLVAINIDNNMNNATYAITAMGAYSDFVQSDTSRSTSTPDSTSRYDLLNSNYNFTRVDSANMNSAVLGDLA